MSRPKSSRKREALAILDEMRGRMEKIQVNDEKCKRLASELRKALLHPLRVSVREGYSSRSKVWHIEFMVDDFMFAMDRRRLHDMVQEMCRQKVHQLLSEAIPECDHRAYRAYMEREA